MSYPGSCSAENHIAAASVVAANGSAKKRCSLLRLRQLAATVPTPLADRLAEADNKTLLLSSGLSFMFGSRRFLAYTREQLQGPLAAANALAQDLTRQWTGQYVLAQHPAGP